MNVQILKNAIASPRQTALQILARRCPKWLFRNYVRLARKQGLIQPSLILSFDCDTDRDAETAPQVTEQLIRIDICPVFAVPGTNLERNAAIYREVASKGCEFINHGYLPHAYWDEGNARFESCTFYHEMSPEQVAEDIRRGHETLVGILGRTPGGFRCPHFGTFQRRDQLRFLHATLRDLGYRYSSSTTPSYGFLHGPLNQTRSMIIEIPVSGCFDAPLNVLDSWAFFSGRKEHSTPQDYRDQMMKVVDYYAAGKFPALLNFYADPSHVAGRSEFFDAMCYASERIHIWQSFQEMLDFNG
ncbi:MAG TPA: polysaccharide deacetylase family protein [bacterium]|nr:polysaccharide deacetylase family protein [bacterium]HQO34130.1 polysaccharide deacetylase family protein [bacterium]